jgi:hypothetical protein
MIASCSVSAKISDSEENLPSKVELGAQSAIDTLILAKSKRALRDSVQIFCGTEKVVLAYFAEQSGKLKPSSLWCRYSMLRTLVSILKMIDISQYYQVVAFLKRKSEEYRPKKSLTWEQLLESILKINYVNL